MAVTRSIPIPGGTDFETIAARAIEILRGQGYEVSAAPAGEGVLQMTVSRGRTGLTNFSGLGLESRVTACRINQDTLQLSVEHEWSNKILALILGIVFAGCLGWVLIVTAAVGFIQQTEMLSVLSEAFVSANGGVRFTYQPPYQQQSYQQPPYQQPPYQQPPYQQPPYQQPPYQQPPYQQPPYQQPPYQQPPYQQPPYQQPPEGTGES